MRKPTMAALKSLGAKLDITVLKARKMNGHGGMYHRMNALEEKSGVEWTVLRGPVWVGDFLMMFLIRPRDDDAEYNDGRPFAGECTNHYRKGNR